MSDNRSVEVQLRAEASIIGSTLFRRELLQDLGGITPAHFVDRAHANAWRRLVADPAITDDLALQIDGSDLSDDHIRRIRNSNHTHATVLRARDYLMESLRRRELRRIAAGASAALDDNNQRSEEVLVKLRRSLETLSVSQTAAQPAHMVATKLKTQGSAPPISTGLASLDYVLHGGLHRGSVTGIFARFKHGKTLMQSTIAHNLEKDHVKTLMITLERREGDVERFIAARCLNIDKQDLDFENPAHAQFWEEYCSTERPLYYLHKPGISIDELRSQILAAHYAWGVEVVLIDYWQLIQVISGKDMNREERQAVSAQIIADLASDTGIAIVITGQLNQDGHPRGGEGILASAGIVIRIQRPDDQEFVFFDTLVSNQGPGRSKGSPQNPAAMIAQPGPHFADYIPATV